MASRFIEVTKAYYDLGFTAFGGPPVHFHILYHRFVTKLAWVGDKTYQELFAVAQALPGPGSTKLAFAIALNYAGFLPALLAFALWSLPGAIGMFGLALGIAQVQDTLPSPVYALLSGLNAATVGLIAQAGMQLSTRAITDGLSRTILIFSACAGLCYTALWYFPVLMASAAVTTIAYDLYLRKAIFRLQQALRARIDRLRSRRASPASSDRAPDVHSLADIECEQTREQTESREKEDAPSPAAADRVEKAQGFPMSLKPGIAIIVSFFAAFVTLMVMRSVYKRYVALKLSTNMILAGTIIFGGGPVVIPLLREYVVQEGWVSSRDFLIGLAIVQAFPGPNFNFAVYLGALTASSAQIPRWVGAMLGFIGIFSPGLILTTGMTPIWTKARRYQAVTSCLRGINAAAVGLIWTAVYRLWQAGNLTESTATGTGSPLGSDPWWIVIAAVAFSANQWYRVPPPVCIVLGGVLGIAWWGVAQ